LLNLLLDESLSQFAEGKQIINNLNKLMINVLDISDRTSCFVILLQHLRESIPSLTEFSAPTPKFTNLVMKCILKMTKMLGSTIGQIQLDAVFKEINLFLVTHPPNLWKDKDHMPLSTVKTVLNEIVLLKGTDVAKHLGMVPKTNPPAVILSYIKLMLKAHHPNTNPEIVMQDTPSDKTSLPAVDQISASLAPIFAKIQNKTTTQEGLSELYKFKQTNKGVDVEPYIAKASLQVQASIRNGLVMLRTSEVKAAPPYSTENTDPNSVTNTSLTQNPTGNGSESYMTRLRNLQQKLGITPRQQTEDSSQAQSSLAKLKERLRVHKARVGLPDSTLDPQSTPINEANNTTSPNLPEVLPITSQADLKQSSSLEQLRLRLAKIKGQQ